jgi:hypothetical protein
MCGVGSNLPRTVAAVIVGDGDCQLASKLPPENRIYDSRSEVAPPAHRKEDGPAGVRSMPVGYPLRGARVCVWTGNLPGRCCVWCYYWVKGRLTSCFVQ